MTNNDPFSLYCQIDIHLFLSFLYFENSQNIYTIHEYLIAKNKINKLNQEFPDFEYVSKHLIVQYFIKNLINQQISYNSKTNIEYQKDYINLLKSNLASDNKIYNRELKLLGILLFNFQFNSQSDDLIKELNIDLDYSQTGPVEALVSSVWHKKAGNYNLQLQIFKEADELGYFKNLNSLNLWYGNALLNQVNDSAIFFLNRFIIQNRNNKLAEYARFKESLFWYINGNTTKSDSLNKLIKESDNFNTSEDKQAFYEINNAKNWTKELVLARLYFDGGRYQKALKLLLASRGKVSNYSNDQKLEYSYRLARIYDKLNNVELSSKFYQMAINSNLDSKYYYPAYSAYYLGNIYKRNGKFEKANHFYELCSQLDSPIYKVSIHKKARQAIQ